MDVNLPMIRVYVQGGGAQSYEVRPPPLPTPTRTTLAGANIGYYVAIRESI